jgi:biotin synthase
MGWHIKPKIAYILDKSLDDGISREEAETLIRIDLHSKETYALMETADRFSRQTFGLKGENHLHIGVNLEPCPLNCRFCSLTKEAGIFTEKISSVRLGFCM